ncbi:MAG TPA: beta-ketoacyl-[acyl-carrier-protein] synthase family protein [Gemmataceae bacterium]|jgi:3-oxoacyl-[acyl-carrier-protein] synthase II|nr:beta-ketoacyl-[acyl-carrier-protein] synthase family protein [Gemmataceae bacterium]
MAGTARRVVFTGLGVLSPIGSDPAAFWGALCDRTSGIRRLKFADPAGLGCQIGGELPEFKPLKTITNKEHGKALKVMARTVQMGLVAATVAFRNAGLEVGTIDPDRAGVEFGAGMIASELDDLGRASRESMLGPDGPTNLAPWGEKGLKEIPPLWMLKYLPNMPSCHASITLDLRGPSNTITQSDAASLMALGEAYRIIQRDAADLFVVGGCESKMNPLSQARHNLFQQLSKRNDDPEKAHRPFDRDRDGSVLGEAAGAFVVEELGHAQKRGAKVLAELAGFATGFDRAKNGLVMAQVIRKALKQAGIRADDVDHVNAQGLAVDWSDRWEAKAINEVFGPNTPVWSLKGNIGSSGAAAGAVELAGTVLALTHGQLPPTLNCDHPDPECAIHVHRDGVRPVAKAYAVKLNFTDMGQVGAAVVRRWDA